MIFVRDRLLNSRVVGKTEYSYATSTFIDFFSMADAIYVRRTMQRPMWAVMGVNLKIPLMQAYGRLFIE